MYDHSFNVFMVPSSREDLFKATIDGYAVVSEVKFIDEVFWDFVKAVIDLEFL